MNAKHNVVKSSKINNIVYDITNKEDVIQNCIYHNHQWNNDIYKYIVSIIQRYDMKHFLNVGCHIGTIALPVSKYIQKVSCIEAYPKTYEHLIRNIEINNLKNIDTYNFAVGNNEEDIYFMGEDEICLVEKCNRLKNNSGGMHVFTQNDIDENTRSANLTDKKIKNKMHKLDNTDIDDFDIMLVDIEGCEYDFLLGAKEKILKNKPLIIIEIWDDKKRKLENMKQTKNDVIDFILNMNYKYIGTNGQDYLFHHSTHTYV